MENITMESPIQTETAVSKYERYQQLCDQLYELIRDETNLIANAANAAALLYHSLPDINWVGFYLAEEDELVLGPFQGKPACSRIRFGKGVCGTAAVQEMTVVVPDVQEFPGHIACDARSRSEIVVPLLNWGKLVGVIDVDSPTLNRFDEDDREGLESIAAVFLGAHSNDQDLPDLTDAAAER